MILVLIILSSDSRMVENAMKKVAQSTPARPKGSPRKKPKVPDSICEEDEVEEIPNPTDPSNKVSPSNYP